MGSTIHRIRKSQAMLGELPREHLVFVAYRMLVLAALSLKNPAFREEQEWRLIHLPADAPSTHVTWETVTVRGVPQVVYKVKLANDAANDITGISIADLLDRVLFGPSQFVSPIATAFNAELAKLQVPAFANKVWYTNIPLRT